MDLQGPEVVRPYAEKFRVTFPVAVDTADILGQAFGLKAIPVSYLIDEVGIIRLKGSGPSPEFLQSVEQLLAEPLTKVRGQPGDLPAAQSLEALQRRVERRPDDWRSRLALAQMWSGQGNPGQALEQCQEAARLRPEEPGVYFTWGLVLLRESALPGSNVSTMRAAALLKLKQARDLDPANWRIRKQIWAIENPDKFYADPSPDYDWQKEELERETDRH